MRTIRKPRDLVRAAALLSLGGLLLAAGCRVPAARAPRFRLALFAADVTVPLGHALIASARPPARRIADPLSARGYVLLGAGKPLVVVSVEWCEIRNDAYDRWREVLADAAGTDKQRVLVTATHVHDAPVVDLTAQRLLEERKLEGSVCDLAFHERAVQTAATALREALKHTQRVTHFGIGEARVEKVACNRRYVLPDGTIAFDRGSHTKSATARAAADGTIDPLLKTLSFWDEDKPVLALHAYATHPMSTYGQGEVSDDFVGLARRRRQADHPHVFQIYVSGASGNITAGKYNDGPPENRPRLAGRVYDAMVGAWERTHRYPLTHADFRCVPLRLEPRDGPRYTLADLQHDLTTEKKPFVWGTKAQTHSRAALGLSWRQRADAGHTIDLPVIDFGSAKLVLLPAESYVEYQLYAQQLCPEAFVVVMGYGECAPGYIGTDQAYAEQDPHVTAWNDWCWVAPGCERAMHSALKAALKPNH